MINRKINNYLENFYKTQKKTLLLTGARQIGKTYTIREFGKTNFKSFVEINFITSPDAQSIFKDVNSAEDVLSRLSLFLKSVPPEGETLIFFDEVQVCPEVVTYIKFLVEEGSYRYVMSGSLLGVELTDLRSAPVGFLAIKEMYPLDFEEFILAIGVGRNSIDKVKLAFETETPIDEFVNGQLLKLFRLYLVVGGMPEAVQKYIDTNNLQTVKEIQQSILSLYRQDISKYDPKNKLYIKEIFDLIPSELNAKNKRFILKNLNENTKFKRIENSFLWLKDAGVALPTYNVEEPRFPLVLSSLRNLFKLFMSDIGLLSCQYDGNQLNVVAGDVNINFGSIFENVVAQELKAHGFSLYYFNSKKQGEIDFIVEHNGAVLPIEVKSGKDYHTHSALNNIMNSSAYDIPKAYVFCNGNVQKEGRVMYLPIYMIMFITHNVEEKALILKPDLSGLD